MNEPPTGPADHSATPAKAANGANKARLLVLVSLTFAAAPLLSPGFGGFDPDLFPVPQVAPPIQPAGWAFAIWGLIYGWLLIMAVYGYLRHAGDPGWDRPRWPLIASLAVGSFWLLVAERSPLGAFALILVMTAGAIIALLRMPEHSPPRQRWLLEYPVALYAGWLAAASAVSLALNGAGYGLLMGAAGWAFLAILLALILGAWMEATPPHSAPFALAVTWALMAIAAQARDVNWSVAALAAMGALFMLWQIVRRRVPRWIREA